MAEEEILERLKGAYEAVVKNDRLGYLKQMAEAKEGLAGRPELRALRGELALLSSYNCFWDAKAVGDLYEKALSLLGGHSRVIPHGAPMLFHSYTPLAVYLQKPGEADQTVEQVARAVRLYGDLTGGGGGLDLLCYAQLARYRGEVDLAVKLAREALDAAEKTSQGLTVLGIAEQLNSLAKYRADLSLWQFSLELMRRYMKCSSPKLRQVAECIYSMARLSVGLLSGIPNWIAEGDLGIIPGENGTWIVEGDLCYDSVPGAVMVRLEYLSYSRKFVEALNFAAQTEHLYQMDWMPVYTAYLNLFRTGCWKYYNQDKVSECLDKVMEVVAPDRLWWLAGEFYPSYPEAMLKAAKPYGEEAVKGIRESGEGFWKKLDFVGKSMDRKSFRESLTAQERLVADLAAEGMKNREIARQMGISVNTVKYHLSNIYSKAKVDNRVKLKAAIEELEENRAEWIKRV